MWGTPAPQLPQHLTPQGLREASQAARTTPGKDLAGVPTSLTGLGLLSLLPSAWGGLRASFQGDHCDPSLSWAISVLPVGTTLPFPHPQVPSLCFYILNWRFIF
jgi:hypothetical protein